MFEIKNKKTSGIILIAIAVFLCLLLVGIRMKNKAFVDSAETTTGYVTRVYKHESRRSSDTYYAYVTYTVDGVEYTTSLTHAASVVDVGDAVYVYYKASNPNETLTNVDVDYNNRGYIPCLLLMVLGIYQFIRGKKEENNYIA